MSYEAVTGCTLGIDDAQERERTRRKDVKSLETSQG